MRSNRPRLAALAGSIALASALLTGLGTGSARIHTSTVQITGTAYEFNNTHVMLSGATIRVAELPKLRATVQPSGRYVLQVPDHAKVTPYIVDQGYHTIYLQTFTTDGQSLVNVNFQTPTEAVYRALVALLKVSIDAQGNLKACAIVSTFNTRNVRGLSFVRFIAYGAHGVAGATATASPGLGKPVYFNQNVVPDPAQRESSNDGGVLWTSVPAGVYTITGHDPATRFARFVATCRPGRVVNANPPWGLHELALPNPARSRVGWIVIGTRTRLTSLRILHLPASPRVDVGCSGRGCLFLKRTFRPSGTSFDVLQALGGRTLRFRPGDTLSVTVFAQAFNQLVDRWKVVDRRMPARTTLCIPLGYERPQRHCPAA